ncbi:MAG TPA: hypothetical protein VLH38_03285 [Patescibacteria group bacterium]|nr:hypothetical protein [Patescibacteria group bacterium]
MYVARARNRQKPAIDKEIIGWPRGYISAGSTNDITEDALADLYNADLDADSLPTPRPSSVAANHDFLGTCIGMGTFQKMVNGRPERYEISMQAIQTSAVQRLAITGSPTGGNFALTYSGQTTATIAFNATAGQVQTALEALSNIGVGDAVCSGGVLPGTPVVITFAGTLVNTDVSLITTNSAGLTGGTTPTATVTQPSAGGLRGVVHIRKDDEEWTAPDDSVRYDPEAEWATFCHSNNRVFVANGVNNLSYYDVQGEEIVTYVEIELPGIPTLDDTGLDTASTYPYFAAVTAFNEAGETSQGAFANLSISAPRESWTDSQYIDISVASVPEGADGLNFYVGTSAADLRLVASVRGATSFHDDGRALAEITKRPPITNSTGGPIVTYLTNILGQVFAWGDIDNPSFVWYDGGGDGIEGSGNFTISGGGGYIGIDDGGPSIPMAVLSYRTGKGDPVPTIVCSGAAGSGGVRHLSFTPQTIGDLTALMPSITEANGSDGTVSPLATVVANNSIHFPTGADFKFYGSAPNIPNILSPNSSSDFILPDVRKLSLGAMRGARALVFEGRVYYALPVISSTNNQLWVFDPKSNPAKWIMPWDIPAKHLWLYEDNSGNTHFRLLVNNKVLQFDRTVFTQDNGVPFRTHVASGPLKWSKSGIAMGYIQDHFFRLTSPRGSMLMTASGEGRNGPVDSFAEEENVVSSPETGFGEIVWGENEFGEDIGTVDGIAPKTTTIRIPIKETMSQLNWEISTEKAGCGYTLGSTFTNGKLIPKLYAGG